MSARRGLAAACAAVVAAGWPALAQACSACGVGMGRNRTAFFVTTIILSLLPLGLIAAGLVWLARNARAFLASEFVDRDDAPVATEAPETGV